MNHRFPLPLGAALLFAGCGSGGSDAARSGGAMSIESCVLGCSNGLGGVQVSCGVANTFQNQEIAVVFSQPVDFASVSKSSFRITDVATGSVPVGNFIVDPANPRRLVFRPELGFDLQGNPILGFAPGASYEILIPGSAQNDAPPYIRSLGGQANRSRLLCTITTDQGISDPVPGPPLAAVFVEAIDEQSGDREVVEANGASRVARDSSIAIVFNDLMNLGTLVVPETGEAPFIRVLFDPDGNLGDATDQVELGGTYTFNIDQLTLQTTIVFHPARPYPGAGTDALNPRKVVVRLPEQIKDLSGSELGNPGPISFAPLSVDFPPVVLPNGPETFETQERLDRPRSGADWGASSPGLLKPGIGGGSGRLGDLVVPENTEVTLVTGPVSASGSIAWAGDPNSNDRLFFNGFEVFLNDDEQNFTWPFVDIDAPFLFLSVNHLADQLELHKNDVGNPELAGVSYFAENGDTLHVVHDTPGPAGNAYTLEHVPAMGLPNVTDLKLGEVRTLSGGKAHELYAPGNLLDNFDFGQNPGQTPGAITVDDGVFEFSSIEVREGATLRLIGPNPARLLSRGSIVVEGVIDASGTSPGEHPSASINGQPAAAGGPFAGAGGRGADREDDAAKPTPKLYVRNENMPAPPLSAGIIHEGVSGPQNGARGGGIAGEPNVGAGEGGAQWPSLMPLSREVLGALETDPGCICEQMGGAGGGGAYALDGGKGMAMSPSTTSLQGNPNTPGPTEGGKASDANLDEQVRELNPHLGHLRGGSGGGGGGAHPFDTATDGNGVVDPCVDPGASILISSAVPYRTHSGASGGGGGGALQLVAGDEIRLFGIVDASGGDGGSSAQNADLESAHASPGGGGSGGAILMQSRETSLALNPGRLNVAGGAGGTGSTGSVGGEGSPGLIRFENEPPPGPAKVLELAERILPYDENEPTSPAFLRTGTFLRSMDLPDSISGAQSCWIRPEGGFFALDFGNDGPDGLGWNMDLVLDFGQGHVTRSYRGEDGPMEMSYEEFWGQLLDRDLPPGEVGAPLVVRFQGAKLVDALDDPCDAAIEGPASPFADGSVTPWVRHPAELEAFSPPPDSIRFVILFDASQADFAKIVGVTNLEVHAQPN